MEYCKGSSSLWEWSHQKHFRTRELKKSASMAKAKVRFPAAPLPNNPRFRLVCIGKSEAKIPTSRIAGAGGPRSR